MENHERLVERVQREQDDALSCLQLVAGSPELEDRLYSRLVDLLVEGLFLDLRRAHLRGEIDRADYLDELRTLAEGCRRAGLLPVPTRNV